MLVNAYTAYTTCTRSVRTRPQTRLHVLLSYATTEREDNSLAQRMHNDCDDFLRTPIHTHTHTHTHTDTHTERERERKEGKSRPTHAYHMGLSCVCMYVMCVSINTASTAPGDRQIISYRWYIHRKEKRPTPTHLTPPTHPHPVSDRTAGQCVWVCPTKHTYIHTYVCVSVRQPPT